MPQIILHHYPLSPFCEKARLALGLKGLEWHSVDVPTMPPRPLLTPMTGGYRRVPVMQIGADIYCDTNIILPTLDRLHPEPALYPRDSGALAKALSFSLERAIWLPLVSIAGYFFENVPEAFLKDRKEEYLYIDISKPAVAPKLDQNAQVLRAQLAWLEEALADGRPFLLGDRPSALDLGYFHPISLIRKNTPPGEGDALLGLAPLVPWYDRVAAIGHGRPVEMSGADALTAARTAKPAEVSFAHDDSAPKPGTRVKVTPDDFAKVPVEGTLVAAGAESIVIHRHDEKTGDVHVHFPRAGFVMETV